MLVEYIEQQGRTDLQLAAGFVLTRHALGDQAAHLGDGAEAPPAELREVHRLLQIPFQILHGQQFIAVELQQLLEGVALGGQQLKAVVVHRHGDRAGPVPRQAPGPEEPDALMHKPPFEGEHEQVAALAAAAELQQDFVVAGQAGEVHLPLE